MLKIFPLFTYRDNFHYILTYKYIVDNLLLKSEFHSIEYSVGLYFLVVLPFIYINNA